jgi:hypothetical protein
MPSTLHASLGGVDQELQDTIDVVSVSRLQAAYADAVTRRAWIELDDLFLPEATVSIDKRDGDTLELTGPRAIGDFIAKAISCFEFFEFVILNRHIMLHHEGADDRAVARLYFAELRQHQESGKWSTAYGIYHDRYRKVDGRWWFDGRRHHSMARTARDFDTFPFPEGNLF